MPEESRLQTGVNLTEKNKKTLQLILIVGLLVLLEIWTFRNVIFGGALVSSSEDGLLAVLMNEHWVNVLLGEENWTSWSCMYPADRTVAYNDMYILHALFFCPLRFMGFDKYMSFSITVIIMHIIGTALMYVFMNVEQKFNPYSSLVGTVAFSFANYYLYKMEHIQFLSLAFVPLIMIAASRYFKNTDNKKIRMKWAFVGILVEVLLFYTSPYMAEFVIVAAIVFVIWLFVFSQKRIEKLKGAALFVLKNRLEFLVYVVFGVVLMIPFCYVYVPLMSNNSREFSETLRYMAVFRDIFNVSDRSALYGAIMTDHQMIPGENAIGMSPLTWILFAAGMAAIIKEGDAVYRSSCATVLSLFLLAIKFGEYALWWTVYMIIPGASGIRVVSRVVLAAIPFVAMVIAWLCDHLSVSFAGKEKKIALDAFCLLMLSLALLADNTQKSGAPTTWTYASAVERDRSFDVAPPEDCKVFLAMDSTADPSHAAAPLFYRGCVDAWLLADLYNVKTINGFASFIPEGYEGTYNIYAPDYFERANYWMDLNHIDDIYLYDFGTKEWRRYR